MKFALIILVIVMGMPWCGCSTATAKIRGLWGGGNTSNIDIPSTQFAETQDEALKGDAVAQFRLGEWYRTGETVKRNTAQAYAWFTISARNGYSLAEARVRAGWSRATIARGKELAEILIDKYPSAVFTP